VEGKEKVDLLSNCMFVVMPSRYESWGNVAIEAAASGKPVIGSDIDGLSDSVLDKKTGILVSVSNVKDLSKSIEHIINNNKLRCELAKNAITWASNFKIHNQTIKQEEIYKSLIGD
jgi:glycosyltransferase involved in cell wall biosynthesis